MFTQLDKIIENFGTESGDKIAEFIYSLPQIGMQRKSFFDYREYYEAIIDPRKIFNPKFRFFLNDAWYDTIEILLNPKMFLKLKTAIKDCQVGNFTLL